MGKLRRPSSSREMAGVEYTAITLLGIEAGLADDHIRSLVTALKARSELLNNETPRRIVMHPTVKARLKELRNDPESDPFNVCAPEINPKVAEESQQIAYFKVGGVPMRRVLGPDGSSWDVLALCAINPITNGAPSDIQYRSDHFSSKALLGHYHQISGTNTLLDNSIVRIEVFESNWDDTFNLYNYRLEVRIASSSKLSPNSTLNIPLDYVKELLNVSRH